MEIKELVEKLESSDEFRSWRKDNEGFYLVHLFYMSNQPAQIGYYDKESDRITTFEVNGGVSINPTSEVFKESKSVPRLELSNVKTDRHEALETVKELIKQHYPKEILDKEMILLQEISNRTVYNVTYFTKAFNTLNIKVDAGTGKVISHDLNSLVSF